MITRINETKQNCKPIAIVFKHVTFLRWVVFSRWGCGGLDFRLRLFSCMALFIVGFSDDAPVNEKKRKDF